MPLIGGGQTHDHSRSQRIFWMLEELKLDYELVLYERDAKTMLAPPELKQAYPLGKSPVVEVDGRTLIETGAIFEYLVAGTGCTLGAPAHIEETLCYRQFLHYAERSMTPPLLTILVIGRLGRPTRRPFLAMFAGHLR